MWKDEKRNKVWTRKFLWTSKRMLKKTKRTILPQMTSLQNVSLPYEPFLLAKHINKVFLSLRMDIL